MKTILKMGYETRQNGAIGIWENTYIEIEVPSTCIDLYRAAREELYSRGLEVRFPLTTPKIEILGGAA